MGKVNTIKCYYCARLDGKEELAHVTLHDQRGCLHVCFKHAYWRMTTSWAFGHSSDCAVGRESEKAPP